MNTVEKYSRQILDKFKGCSGSITHLSNYPLSQAEPLFMRSLPCALRITYRRAHAEFGEQPLLACAAVLAIISANVGTLPKSYQCHRSCIRSEYRLARTCFP